MIQKRKGPAVLHISSALVTTPNRQSCWLVRKLTQRFRTVNAAAVADPECTELVSPNAVQIGDAPDNGWYLISPLGKFPRPNPEDGTQIFGIEQARAVVSTFNSIAGTAGRFFKNMWHGLGKKSSLPIFEGHSDYDPKRWRTMNQLGEVTELHADDQGLWGRVSWNAANLARRTQERGPLKPSPIFWHNPPDERGHVFPEMLESIGLVVAPNIRTAPQWTANADLTLPRDKREETKTENAMNKEQLEALARALNLPVSTDPAKIIETAQSAYQLSTANAVKVQDQATALQTANAAKADLETKLQTANASLQTITAERDQLKTANGSLTTERDTLVKGVLDLAEKKGAITPAERDTFQTRLTTANTAADALKELPGRKAMNTTSIEIDNNRIDLTTANARQTLLQAEINKRMPSHNGDYNAAYASVKADPNFAALFAAMQDPTRKEAA